MLCFLDIDGVCRPNGGAPGLDPKCVGYLNQFEGKVDIVFNTAWNAETLEDMVKYFTEAGYLYPETLIAQTPSDSGGGDPIREWLEANPDRKGETYIIMDDSTKDYKAMWCRLVQIPVREDGINERTIARALELLSITEIDETKERRRAALYHLEAHAIQPAAYWLSDADVAMYVQLNADEVIEILTMDDFLVQANLVKP